jgi:predicted amidohydrolase
MNLVSLQFKTISNYQTNLDKLTTLINQCEENSIIVAPEVCITGYDYNNFDLAINFSYTIIDTLLKLSTNKTICTTIINKRENKVFNTLYIFKNNKIIHTQDKVKLFTFGNEDDYFQYGDMNKINIIDIDGIEIASLICFELRFIDIWQQIKGADIILIPAMWGKLRKQNFESLTNALAIMNQCYVIASDSSNDDMASSSGIINPFGKEIRDDNKEIITIEFDNSNIKKMRRYMDVGIKYNKI